MNLTISNPPIPVALRPSPAPVGARRAPVARRPVPVDISALAALLSVPPETLPQASVLLDGFRFFMQFIVEEETDFLCGTSLFRRSATRTNYRLGYYGRRFVTCIGEFALRIPHLQHFYPRTSIVKRAKRLNPDILAALARIHVAGATADEAAAIVRSVWTLELTGETLAFITGKLVPILEAWRRGDTSSALFSRPLRYRVSRSKKNAPAPAAVAAAAPAPAPAAAAASVAPAAPAAPPNPLA